METKTNKFQREVTRILNEIYHSTETVNSAGNLKRKKFIQTEKKYVDYLVENYFVSILNKTKKKNEYYLQLENRGIEIIEKYKGRINLRKLLAQKRLRSSSRLKMSAWWIPAIISIIVLILQLILHFRR